MRAEYRYRKLDPDRLDRELATRVLGQQDGLWLLDLDHYTLSVDGQLFEKLETLEPEGDSESFDIYRRLHPDDTAHVRAALERHLIDRTPYEVFMRLRSKSGNYLWVRSRGQATWNDEGRPVQMIGVMHDVTDAIALRRSLRDSEDRFLNFAQSLPGALFRYTREQDGSDSIEYMSPGCEAIWEYTADELSNDPSLLWNSVHPDDLADMLASVDASARQLTPWVHSWRIRGRSGGEKWLEGRGTPIAMDGGTVVWHTMVFDRTERVRAQQALEQQREMLHQSQKLASLGRIAGGVAHDFNNLLASILGNAELLLGDDIDDDTRHRHASEIERAAYRGSALSQQLLAFGRRAHLNPSTESITTILEEIGRHADAGVLDGQRDVIPGWKRFGGVEAVEPAGADRARGEGQHAAVGHRIAGVDGQVQQRIVELIAVDVDEQRRRRQHDRDLDVLRYDAREHVAEFLEKVVEPFFTTKPVGEGSGLGLSMVQGYARQSGGAMRIESTPGSGTAITLMLPAAKRPPKAATRQVPEARETRGCKVLLAEDNPAVQNVLRQQLESFGHDVVVASDAAEAIAHLDGGLRPDLLVSDLVMPGPVRGTDLIRIASERLPDLRVIVLSGYHRETSGESASLPASIIWLQKPVTMSHLRSAIADCFDH